MPMFAEEKSGTARLTGALLRASEPTTRNSNW